MILFYSLLPDRSSPIRGLLFIGIELEKRPGSVEASCEIKEVSLLKGSQPLPHRMLLRNGALCFGVIYKQAAPTGQGTIRLQGGNHDHVRT